MARFIEKSGNGSFLFKNGWDSIVFVEKQVGVCRFCQEMGGSGSFLSKHAWEWVVFVKKWVGVGCVP